MSEYKLVIPYEDRDFRAPLSLRALAVWNTFSSQVALIDRDRPYEERAETIQNMMLEESIRVEHVKSHYFPSHKDALKYLSDWNVTRLEPEIAATIEEHQTWFVFAHPTAGDLSETHIYVHNLTRETIRGLVLKYVDAPSPQTGSNAFHIIEMSPLPPLATVVLIVNLYVPPAMFMSGAIPRWENIIVETF